jgi:hypothetical protein
MTEPFTFKGLRLFKRPVLTVTDEAVTFQQLQAGTSLGGTTTIPRALVSGVRVESEVAKVVPDLFYGAVRPAQLTIASASATITVRTTRANAERVRDLLNPVE